MARTSYTAAARALAERDPAMARLLDAAGPPRLREPHGTHFEALVRSILYQQLAGSAAAAIHARLIAAVDGVVEPERILALPPETLRAAGLSGNKAASITDLAVRILDGTVVLDPRRLAREPDEEVITRLSSVRGIGRWTAEMFLIFSLGRLDVLPLGDLGLRVGMQRQLGLAEIPDNKTLTVLAESWRPYRSVATWYLWRSFGPVPQS